MTAMADGGMRRRVFSLGLALALAGALAGCNTVKKTFDFSPDPELQKDGTYPNINVGGVPQPGKPLTPDEQQKAMAAIKAKGAVASPQAGADAKQQGAASAAELDQIARTHGELTLEEIRNGCGTDKVVDATKCPQ